MSSKSAVSKPLSLLKTPLSEPHTTNQSTNLVPFAAYTSHFTLHSSLFTLCEALHTLFQLLPLAHRQLVAAVVEGVGGVTLDPVQLHLMHLAKAQKHFPQIGI